MHTVDIINIHMKTFKQHIKTPDVEFKMERVHPTGPELYTHEHEIAGHKIKVKMLKYPSFTTIKNNGGNGHGIEDNNYHVSFNVNDSNSNDNQIPKEHRLGVINHVRHAVRQFSMKYPVKSLSFAAISDDRASAFNRMATRELKKLQFGKLHAKQEYSEIHFDEMLKRLGNLLLEAEKD